MPDSNYRSYLEWDELAKQALRGGEQAWLGLYTAAWPVAVEFARRTTRLPRDLAEDIAQDAFVIALIKLGDWDSDVGSFAAWFFTLLRRRCVQHWRSNPPNRQAYAEEPDFDVPTPASDASFESIEYREVLRRPLRALTRPQREILFLKAAGFRSHEIGAIMDIKPEAVRQRLIRIRKILKAAIEEEGNING